MKLTKAHSLFLIKDEQAVFVLAKFGKMWNIETENNITQEGGAKQ